MMAKAIVEAVNHFNDATVIAKVSQGLGDAIPGLDVNIPSGQMRCCRPVDVKIGVLALQGDVSEHIGAFAAAPRLRGCGGIIFCCRGEEPGGSCRLQSACYPGRGVYTPSRG